MEGMSYSFSSVSDLDAALGLIVLQSDETLENDMRVMLPVETALYVSRVPSGDEATTQTLSEMADHLTASAALLPRAARFASIGFGCTSGSAEIGPNVVASLIRDGVDCSHITNPLCGLIAACRALGITRLALLSPYVEEVPPKLRSALADAGVETPVFGSFCEADESKVVRIDSASIINAATDLIRRGGGGVDAIFCSCTNLRALGVIDHIEQVVGLPCLCSNQVLAWDMARLAGVQANIPGRLGQCAWKEIPGGGGGDGEGL